MENPSSMYQPVIIREGNEVVDSMLSPEKMVAPERTGGDDFRIAHGAEFILS